LEMLWQRHDTYDFTLIPTVFLEKCYWLDFNLIDCAGNVVDVFIYYD
jgi:hypothetical protein